MDDKTIEGLQKLMDAMLVAESVALKCEETLRGLGLDVPEVDGQPYSARITDQINMFEDSVDVKIRVDAFYAVQSLQNALSSKITPVLTQAHVDRVTGDLFSRLKSPKFD